MAERRRAVAAAYCQIQFFAPVQCFTDTPADDILRVGKHKIQLMFEDRGMSAETAAELVRVAFAWHTTTPNVPIDFEPDKSDIPEDGEL